MRRKLIRTLDLLVVCIAESTVNKTTERSAGKLKDLVQEATTRFVSIVDKKGRMSNKMQELRRFLQEL